jgi:hypothetical protein
MSRTKIRLDQVDKTSLSLCLSPLASYLEKLDIQQPCIFQWVDEAPIDNEYCSSNVHCEKDKKSIRRVKESIHGLILYRYPHTFFQPDKEIRTSIYHLLEPLLRASSYSLLIGGECYGYGYLCGCKTIITDTPSIYEDALFNHPTTKALCTPYQDLKLDEKYDVCIVHTTRGLPKEAWPQIHCNQLILIACHEVESQFKWISYSLFKTHVFSYVSVYHFKK